MQPKFVDSLSAVRTFLSDLGDCHGQRPRLYVDLEGNNLSRHGTLSLVTVMLEPERDFFLFDVTTLGQEAFLAAAPDGRTLQSVLESNDIIKVFFDIRNDSDALFGLYGIRVAGIEDLQLMELASRSFSKRNVNGLARCIERDGTIDVAERHKWQVVKDKGKVLFDPERGGSYAVFDQRPLSEEVMRYCIQDVTFMPHLREVYREKLCDAWWEKIKLETIARIELSQSVAYRPQGQHKARGPSAWLHWYPSPTEQRLRTRFEASESAAGARAVSQLPIQDAPDNHLDDMVTRLKLNE